MAADPGGTTGVAWGWLRAGEDVRGSVRAAVRGGNLWGEQLSGSVLQQAVALQEIARGFYAESVRKGWAVGPDGWRGLHVAVERFDLRPGAVLAGAGALDAVRVAEAWRGLRLGQAIMWEGLGMGMGVVPAVEWQQASAAKGTVTDERLKRMGLWVRGEEHTRDALRHLVLCARRWWGDWEGGAGVESSRHVPGEARL